MGSTVSSSLHALAAEACFPEEKGVDAEQTKNIYIYIYIYFFFQVDKVELTKIIFTIGLFVCLFVLVNIHSSYAEQSMAF